MRGESCNRKLRRSSQQLVSRLHGMTELEPPNAVQNDIVLDRYTMCVWSQSNGHGLVVPGGWL